jgi:hypothetical protein
MKKSELLEKISKNQRRSNFKGYYTPLEKLLQSTGAIKRSLDEYYQLK